MTELVNVLSVQDNIKDEFYIYFAKIKGKETESTESSFNIKDKEIKLNYCSFTPDIYNKIRVSNNYIEQLILKYKYLFVKQKSLLAESYFLDNRVLFDYDDKTKKIKFNGVTSVKDLLGLNYNSDGYTQYVYNPAYIIYIINQMVDRRIIPERFRPKIEKLDGISYTNNRKSYIYSKKNEKIKSKIYGFYDIDFYVIIFKNSIIQLLESLDEYEFNRDVIVFLKKLNEKNGIEFEDYINNWTDRLLNDYKNGDFEWQIR